MNEQSTHSKNAVDGLAFGAWLRTGSIPQDVVDLLHGIETDGIEIKGNPNHDPATGRFTFGPGGARSYRGMTAHGVAAITPVGGGGTDRNGRPVPEMFPPDPYALRTPAEALAHYMGGSGEDRNYYFNKVDTSQVKLSDFDRAAKLIANGKPGLYQIDDVAQYDGGRLGKWENTSSAATVGGLNLRAQGSLAIGKDGTYRFSGRLSAHDDPYDFDKRPGRSPIAEASTTFGRQLPGKKYLVHLIGSKPFSTRGRR